VPSREEQTDGLHLALNIAAMLISFLALIALQCHHGGIHNWLAAMAFLVFLKAWEKIWSLIRPVAWVSGIPCATVDHR